jgi:hypothetical protein
MHKVREWLYIVVVQVVGAVRIYVAAAVEALRKKETQDGTHSVYHQNWWKKN